MHVGGSGAEYINHSCDPNLKTRKIGQHIFYFSKRPIAAGEELSVDYKFSRSAERVPCSRVMERMVEPLCTPAR